MKLLEEQGFVAKERSGRTFKVKLSQKFFEYFDVDGSKDIREVFKKISEPNQRKVEDFEEEPDWYKQGAAFLEEAHEKKINSNIEPKPTEETLEESNEEFSEL